MAMEAIRPENAFICTPADFFVCVEKIKSFSSELKEIDKAEIQIGKRYRHQVLKALL
jgi:hypothetical protein